MSKFDQARLRVRIAAAAIIVFGCVVFSYGLVDMTYAIAVMAGIAKSVPLMGADTLIMLSVLWAAGTAWMAVPRRGEGTDTATEKA